MDFSIFELYESQVRSYCRKYETIFDKAKNAELFSKDGKRYIDFLAVAGSMNYGHNNPEIKGEILDYLSEDRLINALDMYTDAKEKFIDKFVNGILAPRSLDYKLMFCGPTGANSIEAAIKLARKNTKRNNIFAFSGAFHGMSLGALSMTTDKVSREGAGVELGNVTFMPYDGQFDSIAYIESVLKDDHSGVSMPAAIVLETIQAEGGVNVASIDWLRNIRRICDEYGILMIVDDIQVGVGRSGYYFSFERAGVVPDMVVLSKSISGFGLPMSLLLIKPEYDIFRPAEHNGTFRGNQLAFVGGKAGIDYFLKNKLDEEVKRKGLVIESFLKNRVISLNDGIVYRGIGMLWGIDFSQIDNSVALKVVHNAFENGLVLEVAGRGDAVLKIMPPLTIEDNVLMEGLELLERCVKKCINN